MKHRLPCTRAYVNNGAVSVFDVALAGDLGGGKVALSDEFGMVCIRFLQSRKMFFGDNENVSGGLRIDVFKGKNVIVFVDLFRGNFAAEYTAEKAVGRWIGHGSLSMRNDNIKTNHPATESHGKPKSLLCFGSRLRLEIIDGDDRAFP